MSINPPSIWIESKYFREYRKLFGFTNADAAKTFFQAKDLVPSVDYWHISVINERLIDIIAKLNEIIHPNIKIESLVEFNEAYIHKAYAILTTNDIIEKLNNQWRRVEDVYFSWMRGYIISFFFIKALWLIFNVNIKNIKPIGDDNLKNIETFRRSAQADMEVSLANWKLLRLEIQSGFTGINDIKQHKVREAKRIYEDSWEETMVIHFDIFNGQVWFIPIHAIEDNHQNWVTRTQMEWQTVFSIDQNFFLWKLMDKPIAYHEIVEFLQH